MLISVLIPTYRRLALLKRAVDDVFSQTYENWELVVSDDELVKGETWSWLQDLAKKDCRVRIVKNQSEKHGQVFNVNNGLRECKGEWVKILFDDDRILPDCLAKMANVAKRLPKVAMIGCRAQKWRNGHCVGAEKNFARGEVDVISGAHAQEAILMFDRWNGRTPTHMMFRRAILNNPDALMPEAVPYTLPVDWVWFANILKYGDYAMMRDILVCQCEGETDSLTGGVRQDPCSLDRELFPAYHDIYKILGRPNGGKLSWPSIEAEINGVRGVYHLSRGRVRLGLRMLAKMLCSFRGTKMTMRWLLQEMFPLHYAASKRASMSVGL